MCENNQAMEAFEKECGSVEDWGGDKIEWRTAFGFFLHGWTCAKRITQHETDWVCVCGDHNAEDCKECNGCGRRKGDGVFAKESEV